MISVGSSSDLASWDVTQSLTGTELPHILNLQGFLEIAPESLCLLSITLRATVASCLVLNVVIKPGNA